jgi:hypothetical protein
MVATLAATGSMLPGAGGFGAFDIGLRHPALFGRLASWSGYFHPIDGVPFKQADDATLRANAHGCSCGEKPGACADSGSASSSPPGRRTAGGRRPRNQAPSRGRPRAEGIPTTYRFFGSRQGHWRAEFHAGLCWSFGTPGVC